MYNHGLMDNNSWPNIDFVKEVRTYITGYGYGCDLIKEYLNKLVIEGKYENVWGAFIYFLKRPPTPKRMED